MPDDEFWFLIAQSRSGAAADQDRQLAALRARLMRLDPAQIIAFGIARQAQMVRAYTWSLWGAAFLIGGGAADDDFEYFRAWLIAQGRTAFETSLADPDSLADWVPEVDGMIPDFEALDYVDRETWVAKTGRTPDDYPELAPIEPGKPIGDELRDDPAWLASHYPKLWKRFGANSAA